MRIDEKSYCLSDDNYMKFETIKKQIVIGHTGTNKMRHIEKWKNRLNGKYKKTAAFTIDTNGKVYKHFDPIYFSEILVFFMKMWSIKSQKTLSSISILFF
jgi:hypothetical protein